jgi:hypothetical protein
MSIEVTHEIDLLKERIKSLAKVLNNYELAKKIQTERLIDFYNKFDFTYKDELFLEINKL